MAVLLLNALFWGVFLVRALAGRAPWAPTGAVAARTVDGRRAATFAASLVVAHSAAFVLLYAGVIASLRRSAPPWRRVGGAALVLTAAGLVAWTMAVFRSWRPRAVVEPGHVLSTGGPFALVRHPVYAALDLLALGTALSARSAWAWLAAALVVLVGDVRARGEESLLEAVFGADYRAYRSGVRRLVPRLY